SFSGVQAALTYSTSEANSTFGTTSGNVTWSGGPIWLGLGYEVHKFHDSNNDESDIRLAGKFDITNEIYVGALYDTMSNVDGVDNIDGKAWAVLAGFKMANNLFKFQYSKADTPDTTTDLGATLWAIGVDHNFSKTTKVYLDYAKADNDNLQSVNVSSSYAGHGTSSVPAVADGKSPSAISLGMIINF
ncbi:MAG TPA: porin, partial [Sulfuricaulis sp.]|nr:porin [Sulfuricaulis sp.]